MSAREIAILLLVAAGTMALLFSSIRIVREPDWYRRSNASMRPALVGTGLMLLAGIIAVGDFVMSIKMVVVISLLAMMMVRTTRMLSQITERMGTAPLATQDPLVSPAEKTVEHQSQDAADDQHETHQLGDTDGTEHQAIGAQPLDPDAPGGVDDQVEKQ